MSVARLLLCWSMVRGEWSRLTDLADAGLVRPAARSEHVAAWDEVNQVLLIHGGSNLEGDLWAFDAASEAWTRTVTAVAPAARAAHAAGWDPANHALWVHGGYNSQTLAWFRDGWRLQSGAWTLELHDAGPSSREAHIAVWDESTAALWVHGGWTGTRHLSDLWRYNSNAHGWQELLLSGTPSGRSSHVAVWDSTRHAMWLHGGYGDALLADLWTLHAATLSWTEVPFSGGPSPRSGHTAVWDDSSRLLWLHGGNDGFLRRDLWRYDSVENMWSLIAEHAGPSARWSHVAAWDDRNQILYIHGGYNGSLCGDLWSFWVTTTSTTQTASSISSSSSQTSTSSSISWTSSSSSSSSSSSTSASSSTSTTATSSTSASSTSSSTSSTSCSTSSYTSTSSSTSSSRSSSSSVSSSSSTSTRSTSTTATFSTSSSSTSSSTTITITSTTTTSRSSSSTSLTLSSSSTSQTTSSSSSISSSSSTSTSSTSSTVTSSTSASSTSSSTGTTSTSTTTTSRSSSSTSHTSTSRSTSSTSSSSSSLSSSSSTSTTSTSATRTSSTSTSSTSSPTSTTTTSTTSTSTSSSSSSHTSTSSSTSSTSSSSSTISSSSSTSASSTSTTSTFSTSLSSTSTSTSRSSTSETLTSSTSSTRSSSTISATHTTSTPTTFTTTTSTSSYTAVVVVAPTPSQIISRVLLIVTCVIVLAFGMLMLLIGFCANRSCCIRCTIWSLCCFVRVVPVPAGLQEPRPSVLPDRKGRYWRSLQAPVFARLDPCSRSPCAPLVVLVDFAGAPRVSPRVWLVPRSPLPQSVPAARHEREPQPSPKLPQQPLAGFCPQRSSESLPERPTQQYPQNRILPASPASCPSMARPKKQQTRPHQLRIQVVLCTECPSALPAVASQPSASRSQPRVQLVPAPPPAWPMDTHQRREAKPFFQEIDVLPPLPLPFLLCPCSVGEGEHWIRYPTSPMPKEVAHGQPSPPAPSFTRLEPPANRPCQRAPAAQPSEVGAMQRASSQPRVDLVPASVVNLLGLSRRPTDMPLLHEPQTLSPSSRSLGFRQPELRSPCVFLDSPRSKPEVPDSPSVPSSHLGPPTEALGTLSLGSTQIIGGQMWRYNSTPAWSQSRSTRIERSVSMSPGPGNYDNPEELSFDTYMRQRLKTFQVQKEAGRRIAKEAKDREAKKQSQSPGLHRCWQQGYIWEI